MNIFGKLFGSAVGETVKGVGEGVSTLATGLRSAITGELPPEKRAELEKLALQAESLSQTSQMEINKIEAQSASVFVAGWRPFIGWICGVALGLHFVVGPLIRGSLGLFESKIVLPALNVDSLYPIVTALLGLGALRSFEKSQNVSDKH